MSGQTISIYIRNSQKIGKIIEVKESITAKQLYEAAASAHDLSTDSIHLYNQGKLVPIDSQQCSLKQKAIVHLVSLQQSNSASFSVNVKVLGDSLAPTKIQVEKNQTIKEFIDDKLFKILGEKSDKLVLIHIGRQLKLDKTFSEEDIQNESQLFCVNIETLRAQIKQKEQGKDINQNSEENKNVYTSPTFPLEPREEVNATNKVDLIYDSKIHHSSSLPDYNLPESQVIKEEQNNPFNPAQQGQKEEEGKSEKQIEQIQPKEEKEEILVDANKEQEPEQKQRQGQKELTPQSEQRRQQVRNEQEANEEQNLL